MIIKRTMTTISKSNANTLQLNTVSYKNHMNLHMI